jgi:hypothetical protein
MNLFLTSDSQRHSGVGRKTGSNDFRNRKSMDLSLWVKAPDRGRLDDKTERQTRRLSGHGLEGSTVTMHLPMAEGNERGTL